MNRITNKERRLGNAQMSDKIKNHEKTDGNMNTKQETMRRGYPPNPRRPTPQKSKTPSIHSSPDCAASAALDAASSLAARATTSAMIALSLDGCAGFDTNRSAPAASARTSSSR